MRHWSKTLYKKYQITRTKIELKGRKMVRNGYLYAPFSQKYFSKSKTHSLNEAHDRKLLSLRI